MIAVVDLREGINDEVPAFVYHITPRDIKSLYKVKDLIKQFFDRPWAYVGSKEPLPANEDFIAALNERDLGSEGDRVKNLLIETQMPFELLVVLRAGDPKEFHNHVGAVRADLQFEQYMVPEGEDFVFEVLDGEDVRSLNVEGPAVVFACESDHRRERGECFVVKFPSGDHKRVVEK